jgi:hypothetical protein
MVTHASPGMGKSSLFDAICLLSEAQVRSLSPAAATAEFCKATSSSLRITVDYKYTQPVSEIDIQDPTTGLATRILHSYVSARICDVWW